MGKQCPCTFVLHKAAAAVRGQLLPARWCQHWALRRCSCARPAVLLPGGLQDWNTLPLVN